MIQHVMKPRFRAWHGKTSTPPVEWSRPVTVLLRNGWVSNPIAAINLEWQHGLISPDSEILGYQVEGDR